MFFHSGGRNESNSQQRVPTRDMKTFHELDVHHVQKVVQQRVPTSEMKTFHELDRTLCLESRNQTFLDSGGRNESNSHELARIGGKKIFHELGVHYVQKVGIKRFWANETEMSLTATCLFQQGR